MYGLLLIVAEGIGGAIGMIFPIVTGVVLGLRRKDPAIGIAIGTVILGLLLWGLRNQVAGHRNPLDLIPCFVGVLIVLWVTTMVTRWISHQRKPKEVAGRR